MKSNYDYRRAGIEWALKALRVRGGRNQRHAIRDEKTYYCGQRRTKTEVPATISQRPRCAECVRAAREQPMS
jgi:hypothetical protein